MNTRVSSSRSWKVQPWWTQEGNENKHAGRQISLWFPQRALVWHIWEWRSHYTNCHTTTTSIISLNGNLFRIVVMVMHNFLVRQYSFGIGQQRLTSRNRLFDARKGTVGREFERDHDAIHRIYCKCDEIKAWTSSQHISIVNNGTTIFQRC